MYPHPELIECKCHPYTINSGSDFEVSAYRPAKQKICTNRGKQKYAVIKMMDVRPFEIQVQVGYQFS